MKLSVLIKELQNHEADYVDSEVVVPLGEIRYPATIDTVVVVTRIIEGAQVSTVEIDLHNAKYLSGSYYLPRYREPGLSESE